MQDTSRNGFYVIQTQEAADRHARKRVDLTQDKPAAVRGGLKANPRKPAPSLTRLERELSGAAWHAYMAGRHAVNRDNALRKASETLDVSFRSLYAKSAREWHHCYLQSARSCRTAMNADKAMLGSHGRA